MGIDNKRSSDNAVAGRSVPIVYHLFSRSYSLFRTSAGRSGALRYQSQDTRDGAVIGRIGGPKI